MQKDLNKDFLVFSGQSLYCPKCGGKLFSEPSLHFPDFIKEYYCINCGLRFWIDMREFKKLSNIKESGIIPIVKNLS